jgi:hypothetical protein
MLSEVLESYGGFFSPRMILPESAGTMIRVLLLPPVGQARELVNVINCSCGSPHHNSIYSAKASTVRAPCTSGKVHVGGHPRAMAEAGAAPRT